MGNILDYLDWRGDVPFSADPFNEVDNLIFAQAAYTRLDGILDEEGEISPEDAAEAFFQQYSREEVKENHSIHKDAPFILEKIAHSKRYEGLRLCHYINHIDEQAQISAVTFLLPGLTYVSFRGTDDSLAGWKEDFTLSFLPSTEGQRLAVEYINSIFSDEWERIFVGGHSKGGNFAVFASAFCEPHIRERIEKVFSNDGPGFRSEVTESEEYLALLPKVVSILPESTLVGTLFNNSYKHDIVKSSETGLMQHDATTWQVLGNSFVKADSRSEESLRMDEAVSNWLSELSDEDKVFFTDVLFNILQTSGASTLEDISEGGLGGLAGMIMSMYSLPKEKLKDFTTIIGKLFKSVRNEISQSYIDSFMAQDGGLF